jgi:transcriptional regulator with XRE-family HTH domain
MRRSDKKLLPVSDPNTAPRASDEDLALAQSMIEARNRAGLTQSEVARRIKTSQSVVARLESGASMPSTRTLQRFAKATGSRLSIRFERVEGR